MCTPTRRASLSDSQCRFTPSKRGQAALDALALGYDVQLAECSLALLPRSSVSEQALTSFLSVSGLEHEQLTRSASLSNGMNQHSASEVSDRQRFAHGTRSRGDSVLFSSAEDTNGSIPLASDFSHASSPTGQLGASQYILPHTRGSNGPSYHPKNLSDAPHSRRTPNTSPTKLARRPHSQSKPDRNLSVPSPVGKVEASDGPRGPASITHQYSNRVASLSDVSKLKHSLDSYFSPRSDENRTSVQALAGSMQYTRHSSRPPVTRLAHDHGEGLLPGALPRALKSPIRGPTFLSGANYSPVYQTRRLPEDDRGFTDSRFATRSHSQHHYSSSEPANSSRRSSFSHTGSQKPQLTPSLMVSPLPLSSGSATASTRSLHHISAKPQLRVSTQAAMGSTPRSLRSAPLSSAHTAHTPSSSRTTSSFHDDMDDEVFKVHPERAALSRMESLLMLNACRYEVEGRKAPWNSSQGYDRGGISTEVAEYPPNGIAFVGGLDGVGHTGVQFGSYNQTPTYPNALGLGDMKIHGLPESSVDFCSQAIPAPSNQERSPASRRGRRRSGTMGPSTFSEGPLRGTPNRHRQRSSSMAVQGLSPEAVKKLRMYETVKYQEGGKNGSLRAMIGYDTEKKRPNTQVLKRVKDKGYPRKAPMSPARVPIPLPPIGIFPSPLNNAVSILSPILAPLSPCNVPLPPSPSNVPLPPSPPPCPTANKTSSPIMSSLMSSDSLMRYKASQGIESPRPMRTRQNTVNGCVVPTFRLISSPEKIDRRSVMGTLDAGNRVLSGGGAVPDEAPVQVANPHSNLRPEPKVERILTPPPPFWSPPPLSTVIRTSAPLLPAVNVPSSTTVARKGSISLPATRTLSAPPLRPMSVPASNESLRVGGSDEVRRAWSCEPPTAKSQPVKSFAGDWNQCMVIDISDEEDELESTDPESSEDEEDEELLDRSVSGGFTRVLETVPSSGVESDAGSRVKLWGANVAQEESWAARHSLNKGGVSVGMGSGVDAVEAVQCAIVRLALDNAGTPHKPHVSEVYQKPRIPPSYPVPTPNPPVRNQLPQRQSSDMHHPYEPSQLRALTNSYFSGPGRSFPASNSRVYPRANHALDTLRSGLELRAAASASAVEEAVRARSASPSLSNQDATHALGIRSASGFVLPPRLQRLQGMNPRTSPQRSLGRLDMPVKLQQPGPLSSIPFVPTQSGSIYSQAPGIPQQPALSRSHLPDPMLKGRSSLDSSFRSLESGRAMSRSEASRIDTPLRSKTQLPNIIVGSGPVSPAPATAPMTQVGEQKYQPRRSTEAALNKPKPFRSKTDPDSASAKSASIASAPTSATPAPVLPDQERSRGPSTSQPSQSTNSSPQSKGKGRNHRRYHKKKPAPEVKDSPKSVAPAPAPAPALAPPPAPPKAPAAQPEATPTASNNAPGSKKKNKRYKKSKPRPAQPEVPVC